MTPSPTTPNQKDPTPPNHQAILAELIDLGTDLARRVHAAAPQPGTRPTPEIAQALHEASIAFDRIARAVRRTIRLADHLARIPAPNPAAVAAPAPSPRTEKRKHVLRRVENAIARARREPAEAASLRAELLERLDSPYGESDIATQPLEHVVTDILRDLGLAEPGSHWPRRTPNDLAELQGRAERLPAAGTADQPPDPERARTAPPPPWPGPHPLHAVHRSP